MYLIWDARWVSQGRGSSFRYGSRVERANLSMKARCLGTAQERATVRKGSAGHEMENTVEEKGCQSEKTNLVCQVRIGGEGWGPESTWQCTLELSP